jgi:hypothetical protein
MSRFQNRNNRGNAIAKGSEFRTAISLASFGSFCEGGDEATFFRSMNNFFKNIPRYSLHCHRRAMCAP